MINSKIYYLFGLIYTFTIEETCVNDDEITDTPTEKTSNYLRETCPNDKGKDPINNFMDSSTDYCMNDDKKTVNVINKNSKC